MARLSQAVVLLLLLSSALAFRISQHHVHKKDGHDHDLQLERSQLSETQDKPLEDTSNSIPEDAEIAIADKKDVSEDPGMKPNQEDTEDYNQEDTKDNNQEDLNNNQEDDTKDTNREDTKDDNLDETEYNNQENTEDNNHDDTEDRSQKDTEHKSKSSILSMSGKAETAVRSNASIYAFSAELSSDVQVSSGATILFDKVLVNEGGLYFGTSGQFACTDEGVYVFMWTLRHTVDYRGLGALAFGGENIKSGPKTSYYASSNINGNSQMVSVVQCRLSPVTAVTVRSMYSSPPTYWAGYTSFAGFRLSPDAASAVAFTAELSEDVPLFPGGRIMFDNVVSNVGGHYDYQNGFFRCPDDGVYSFSVSTYYPKASNQWSVSRLMFDGRPVLQGPMTYRATASYDSGSSSVTVLMQCQQDKNFHVEAERSYTFVSTEYGADLTSFSGFRLCSQCDELVAFSAVLAQNITTDDMDVPFSNVLLNHGNAFDPMAGVFLCPDDALYMFQWSATMIYGRSNLDLYVNESRTKHSYMTLQTTSSSSGTSGTSSQSAVIRCSAGDSVSLRASRYSSSCIILAEYTTFSGYRLPGQ